MIKARSELERARMKNPKNAELWLESVRIEARSDTPQLARERLARGLQVCFSALCKAFQCSHACRNVPMRAFCGQKPFGWSRARRVR